MFGIFIVVFAFVLGFSLSRASTCTVAATTRLVIRGKPDWLIGIAIAVCVATVSLLVLKMSVPAQLPTARELPIDAVLVIASIGMGIGAWLNNGCFIGTIGRLTSGDSAYLMTFVGLVVARKISADWQLDSLPGLHFQMATLGTGSAVFWGATGLAVAGAVYGLFRVVKNREQAILALCVMGLAAALTFASNPDWSYEAWVGRILSGKGLSQTLEIELTILALFAGATIGSVLNSKFSFQAPRLRRALLCFFGGILMGLGAIFTGGGNDTLLLWTIPNFVLHGLVAYAVMIATVAVLVLVKSKLRTTAV